MSFSFSYRNFAPATKAVHVAFGVILYMKTGSRVMELRRWLVSTFFLATKSNISSCSSIAGRLPGSPLLVLLECKYMLSRHSTLRSVMRTTREFAILALWSINLGVEFMGPIKQTHPGRTQRLKTIIWMRMMHSICR